MIIDIRTVIILLSIINILQVIGFALQYLTNKKCPGLRSLLFWSIFTAAGFILMVSRDFIPVKLIPVSIFATNMLLLIGHLYLYRGISQFFGIQENYVIIVILFLLVTLCSLYFIFVHQNGNSRISVLYFSVSFISLFAAKNLIVYNTVSVRGSSKFLSFIFIVHSCYFFVRTILALTIAPFDNVFTPTLFQITTFLVQICVNYLLAFGLIVMINQKANAQISEAKERFESLFSTSPDMVLITRLDDGTLVEINNGFTENTGYNRNEVIGKRSIELDIWENSEDRGKVLSEICKNGFCNNMEINFKHKNGNKIVGMISAKPINLTGIEHIISVTRNITDRKLAEEAQRKIEEKFRLLVENSHDIIYILTHDGFFTFVSPAWQILLGHNVEDVVGKSFQLFVHPEDWDSCMIFLQSVIEKGERLDGIEYRVRHINGTWYWHTSSAVPFKDDMGRISGFYGIARDVTENKNKEARLKEMVVSLQKAIEEIKTLKGIIPICASCKSIRNDKGYWERVESYISTHTDAQFSHGICPDCMQKLYPEFYEP